MDSGDGPTPGKVHRRDMWLIWDTAPVVIFISCVVGIIKVMAVSIRYFATLIITAVVLTIYLQISIVMPLLYANSVLIKMALIIRNAIIKFVTVTIPVFIAANSSADVRTPPVATAADLPPSTVYSVICSVITPVTSI